jgi:phosphohistidine swiveling domain-containing protein
MSTLTLREVKNNSWLKFYAGNWSVMTLSYWGQHYTNNWKKIFGDGLTKAILFSKKGHATSFFEKVDYKRYGEHLAKKAFKNEPYVKKWCDELKLKVDQVIHMIEELKNVKIGKNEFTKFIDVFTSYGPWHSGIKILVDHLPVEMVQKFLPEISEVRKYSEKTFVETEKFFELFAKQLSKKIFIPSELILCMTKEEIETYFEKGKVPNNEMLKRRYSQSVLLFKPKEYEIKTGKNVDKIEDAILKISNNDQITGQVAFPGLTSGIARVVVEAHKVKKFNRGDILITGMTRPDFIPLIKMSGGVVTDGGGVLCHAAVAAREFKKVTIVGTEVATKMFKDGDFIIVDGNKGIVKKQQKRKTGNCQRPRRRFRKSGGLPAPPAGGAKHRPNTFYNTLQFMNKGYLVASLVFALILVGFGCNRKTDQMLQNPANNFVRNIVFSQYASTSGTVNNIFLDKDNKYGNDTNTMGDFDNTTRTNKVIIETTRDVDAVETLESPDKKSIVFMVHSGVPLTIQVNTPEDSGPYVDAGLKTVFSYDIESDTVSYLFDSKRTQGGGFCLNSFSPDNSALLLHCGAGMVDPEDTFYGNVYSFVNKKFYELGPIWGVEWLSDGRLRYRELKDKACSVTNYYICHPESECKICYRDKSEMPWKYIQYK